MMATPCDLEDFAVGFALSERLAASADDIVAVDCHRAAQGEIVRVTLSAERSPGLFERVRHRTSDSACGLCGIENLEQALRPLPPVPVQPPVAAAAIFRALAALRDHQPLNRSTGAAHAAARCSNSGEIVEVREDVGRHNAFDKLIGAMARRGGDWDGGFALLSSRLLLRAGREGRAGRLRDTGHDLRGDRPGDFACAGMRLDAGRPGPRRRHAAHRRRMRLLGAILAGGQSRRFGSDKAMADLGGRPMIVRVAEAVAPFVEATVICGHPAVPAGMVGVADLPCPGLGPLGGLAGALHHAAAQGFDAVLSVGCDTPVLDADLMARLRDADTATFVVQSPVIGRWPADLAAALMVHLGMPGSRSMRGWAEAVGAIAIDALVPIPNVNTPADLDRLLPPKASD